MKEEMQVNDEPLQNQNIDILHIKEETEHGLQ